MKRHGFTLVELIVVILLIGILAAIALPRFLELDEDARIAKVRSTIGSITTSINHAHAVWVIEAGGNPAEDLQVFGTEQGGQLDFNANGWPSQQFFGAPEANPSTNNVADCISVATALLHTRQTFGLTPDADYIPNFLGGGRCRYIYAADPNLRFDYFSNTGRVVSGF